MNRRTFNHPARGRRLTCPWWPSIIPVISALLLAPSQLHAQDYGPPTLPSEELQKPQLEQPGKPPEILQVPTPPPAAAPRVGTTPRTFLRGIRVTGNTVFSDEALAEVAKPYVGREVTDEDLAALRQALTLKYVNAGYLNSGAVIPDQKVADGVVEYRIVEGTLNEIKVTGTEHLHPDYVSDRLALGAGPPLNVVDLQEQLQILLQRPFIQRINAELLPGDRPGQARLLARVEEGPRGDLWATVDNDLSPSLGNVRGTVLGQFYNPSGRGDILSGSAEHAEGYSKLFGDYGIPLNAKDLTLDVFTEWEKSKVVEEPLNTLDITSQGSTLGVRLSYPLFHTARQELKLSGGFDRRRSKTELANTGFAFAPGVEDNGESKVSVLRFILDYVARDRNHVIAARSTLSKGIGAFDATDMGNDLPNGKFTSLLGQFQYARRLDNSDAQMLIRFDGQVSNKPLLPLEQFAVGGQRTVRGYRTNLLVRDQGFASSVELRLPVLRRGDGAPLLQLAPFVDIGRAWYRDLSVAPPQTLKSEGLGLHYDPTRQIHAELYYAHAFDDPDMEPPSTTLQDRGWNFMIRVSL